MLRVSITNPSLQDHVRRGFSVQKQFMKASWVVDGDEWYEPWGRCGPET